MGKSSKAPTPPDPYQTASAEAQFNRLDTYSPSGAGVRQGYTDAQGNFRQGVAPQGSQSAVQAVESPWERQIRQLLQPAATQTAQRIVTDNVTNMPGAPRVQDRGTVADSIFGRTMSMLRPQIDQSNQRLITNLQARGMPVGGEAFNDAMGEQQRQTNDTISRLAIDADIGAGQEQSRQFGLDSAQRQGAMAEIIAAMGGSYNPPSAVPSGAAQGVNYSGAVGQQYQQQMAQYQSQQQQRASTMGTLGSLGAAALMKSDRRIKRDIAHVGQRGGLNLYRYRYVWDRPGTVRHGYMAQEVALFIPQAVHRLGRWLALDYSLLPEVTP